MSTNDGCRADKRKARAEKDTPTVEAVALRVLGEHVFDFSGVRVQRDRKGGVTGYMLACTCGYEFPPSRDENYHLAHIAASLAAAIEARP